MSKSIDIFGKIYKEVTLNYVDDVNPEEFMLSGIKGMLESLDPYTVYIDENMKKDIDLMTKGKYGGIGASVGIRNDNVTIVDLIEGYSAERQGMRIGDIIRKVNDQEISVDNYDELSGLIKGEPGAVVNIEIERDGDETNLVFEIILEEVIIKNITYYGFVPEESNNVYLKLSSFSRSAGDEIRKALTELKNQKEIKSIILDLRSNPGGLLDQAIDVSEKFLKKDQLIVSVKGRDSTKLKMYKSKEEPVGGDARLVVLVNNYSASASEIVAGAIQDHDRGVILGNQSFGKGLVQTLVPLSYNTSLKITTARYFTPSGRCIQKIDYSSNKDVLNYSHIDKNIEFKTDNNREVFAAGGIEPDTVISNRSESRHIRELLARGMFFRFATNYFNSIQNINLEQISNSELYDKFMVYLKDEEFCTSSKSMKLISQLKESLTDSENSDEILNSVKILEEELKNVQKSELSNVSDEITNEIRKELAGRIYGRDGRIKESLKNDKQFSAALDIINQGTVYSNLLAYGE
jgi:carboxyl-terminal processing protease